MSLTDVLPFTDEDLQANKRGELSTRQKRKLRRRLLGNIGIAVFMQVSGIVIQVIIAPGRANAWIVFALFGLFNLCVFVALVLTIRHYRKHVNVASPAVVEGVPEFRQWTSMTEGGGNHQEYGIVIDNQKVDINKQGYEMLLNSEGAYRLFFIPGTNTFLSIEKLQGAANDSTQ
jgi:hypothetical protein